MLCPKCEKQIANNSKFCKFCGEKIKQTPSTIFCSECGIENDFDEKYCSNCYKPLHISEEEPGSQPKNALGFWMGFLLGIIGFIIGLCAYPYGSNSRKTYISACIFGFVLGIILTITITLIVVLTSLQH